MKRWLLVLLAFAFMGASPVARSQPSPPPRVLVVLAPGLRADDLTSPLLPTLQTLRAEGAAGWMVCRAARTSDRRLLNADGRDKVASLALTLGSGARALVPAEGTKEQKDASPFLFSSPSFAALLDVNRHLDHAVQVGALGDLIHQHGWRTAALGGNSAQLSRDSSALSATNSGTLLAMDGTGSVDYASPFLRAGGADASAPNGLRDDVDGLAREAARLPADVALAVIVFSDLARADAYAPLCLPHQAAAHRVRALQEFDSLLEQLRRGRWSRLYVLSPAPAASTDTQDRLAPVLMSGAGIGAGTLTSPSTRTPGVVVNTDFLPSVSADLGIAVPVGMAGRPFVSQPSAQSPNTADAWRAAHDRLMRSERLKDAYGGLPTLQTLLVLTACFAYYKNRKRTAHALGVAIVALPLGMLLLPSLPFVSSNVWSAGAALAVFVLVFAVGNRHIKCRIYRPAANRPVDEKTAYVSRLQSAGSIIESEELRTCMLLLFLFGAFVVIIVLDLVSGSHLLRQAWMSYSVMETARFYGIGNEYMGVVIGAACILSGVRRQGAVVREETAKTPAAAPAPDVTSASKSRDDSRKQAFRSIIHHSSFLIPLLILLVFVFVLGYNRFGAKVGAIPSAGCALGVEWLVLWRGRLRLRDLFLPLALSLLLLGALAWLDMRHSAGEQSHLARAFAGGSGGLLAIARRKLLLEGYLLLHSPWSAALWSAAGVFWWLRRQQTTSETANVSTVDARERAITVGLVVGAVTSLLCNDSGVTAAAMILLFGCAWRLAYSPPAADQTAAF